MGTKTLKLLLTGISLLFIFNLSRSIYTLWQKQHIVTERLEAKNALEKENGELKEKLTYTESLEFLEQQARDKLNLQKEGELVVVLPKADLLQEKEKIEEKVEDIPNWQKWWRLFR